MTWLERLKHKTRDNNVKALIARVEEADMAGHDKRYKECYGEIKLRCECCDEKYCIKCARFPCKTTPEELCKAIYEFESQYPGAYVTSTSNFGPLGWVVTFRYPCHDDCDQEP